MLSTTLEEFLMTGSLGPLRFGLTPNEVELICGKPDAVGGEPHDILATGYPRIWKYRSLQVGFCRVDGNGAPEILDFIGLYFRERRFSVWRGQIMSGWWPNSKTSFDEFTTYISSRNIDWSYIPILTSEDQVTIRAGIGVTAPFHREEPKVTIDSLQVSKWELEKKLEK